MLFEERGPELMKGINEMLSDADKAAKAAAEIIPILISQRSDSEKAEKIYGGKAIGILEDIFEKQDTYNDVSGLPDILLAYLIGKNPKCFYDTIQIYERNEAACSEWVGNELFKPSGGDLVEYQIMQRASAILLMNNGNKDLKSCFLRCYKSVYNIVDEDTEAWKRRMAVINSYTRNEIACLLYYAYDHHDMVTNKSNCYSIEGTNITNMLEELVMNILRMKLFVYSQLVTNGTVELAAWMQRGSYSKNRFNMSLAYADRVMLETETWHDVCGESEVNEQRIHDAVPFYQDPQTVKELLRRLTVLSEKYNKLVYRCAAAWNSERKDHYPIGSIETFENYKKAMTPLRRW